MNDSFRSGEVTAAAGDKIECCGASSPIRCVVSHRLQSADSGHSQTARGIRLMFREADVVDPRRWRSVAADAPHFHDLSIDRQSKYDRVGEHDLDEVAK